MRSKFSELEDEQDDGDEADWKDSYSDLMTDLLAVFVLLLSFAMLNQAAISTRAKAAQKENMVDLAPKISIFPEQEGVLPAQDGLQFEEDDFNELYESIKEYINVEGLSKNLNVTKQGNDQILLRVAASVFFESGSADINTNAEPLLDRISDMLVKYKKSIKIVRIEGHTDDRPIKNSKYDSNWELSASRAVNVLRRIVEISQLEPEQFSAVGYSEFYPIAENDTVAGRAKNRRVDFFIESVD
ncbi:MAG: OmpA family protein [Anaerocolumna aminovalerica]|jgi:chemotaxis protein MotB|uniref:OmpA/MotB family protein n=1 Tax=Anaerocolumna aminovalerica TaxID=1527 RepID=UPI00248ADED9|nr:OmpA family protein [Anaerocolumna aminovalerica]MDU6263135.1 OmpA family protein [Anaerocolumna aminovalerica]